MSLLQRVLNPVVDVRENETVTALLMFVYAFLAMTAYNIIQPLTRSRLINSLGAVNVPWVVLGSGLVIGVLMLGYTRIVSILPRRWALPITQAGMAAAMLGFWALFQTGAEWVSVGFYVWGSLLGILQEFAARAINLTKLESRPTKKGLGDYCFIIDLEGHISDELVADCLRNLHSKHSGVKFLGSYPAAGDHGEAVRQDAHEAWNKAAGWVQSLRDQIV